MARNLLAATAAALSLLVLAAAAAAAPIQSIQAQVSPARAGTKKKPRAVSLRVALATRTGAAGEPAPVTTKAEVFLPSEFVVGWATFPSCTAAILRDQNDSTQCQAKSKVGLGSARMSAAGITENLRVTVYNGPKGKSLLLHLEGQSPAPIDEVLEAKVTRAGEQGYGQKLTVPVPAELQQVSGQPISLSDLAFSLKRNFSRKGRPFVALGPCTDKELSFKVVSNYSGIAEPGVGETTKSCS